MLNVFSLISLSKAMSLLKKKRAQEQLLNQTDGQLDNLEQMVTQSCTSGCWGGGVMFGNRYTKIIGFKHVLSYANILKF